MKKFSFILLLIISLFPIFALDKICVVPSNIEIENNIKEFLNTDVVHFSNACTTDDLLTEDKRLFDYICRKTDADILIIPVIDTISSYDYLKIYCYNNNKKDFSLIYEKVAVEDKSFGFDSIKAIYGHLEGKEDFLLPTSDDSNSSVYLSNNKISFECSNTVADVYIDGKYVGKTPIILDNYFYPSIVKFTSEGFSEKSYYISNDKTESVKVSLIPSYKSDYSNLSQSKNKYFKSFALAILGWGTRIAFSNLEFNNQNLKKALNIASWGIATSTTAILGYQVYDYFKSTQNTAP